MADGAKFRLYVEGEKEFKAALSDINAVLKVSRSELKMLAEQYKITESPMDTLKEQQESLSGAMELQGEKSRQIAEQIKKTSEVYGEHDARVKSLVISYNESEAELARLQAEYKKATETVNDAEAAVRDMEAAQDGIREATAKFNETLSVAKKQLEGVDTAAKSNKKTIGELDDTYDELTQAIAAQKKNAAELTENLKKAEKAYGTGSEATKKYRKQLEETTRSIDDMSEAADDNRKKVGEMSKDGEGGIAGLLSGVQDIAKQVGIEIPGGLDSILGKMGGLSSMLGTGGGIAAVAAALKGYIGMVDSTSTAFSDMKASAEMLGLDTTAYQKLEYALSKAGVSVDSLTEVINPLYSKIKETNDVVGKYAGHMEDLRYATEEERKKVVESMNAWNEYGVALYDAEGNLRGVDEIFYDLIETYSQTANKTERMAQMQKIFGEAASKVNPIVENGGSLLREYGEEAERTGKILDESLVQQMDNVNTTLDVFKSKWENVKNGLGAAIINFLGGGDKAGDYFSYAWENFKGMFSGYASGTSYAPGGWSIVGEKGPEIVHLPRGTEVYPNGIIPQIGGNSEVNNYNIQIRASDVHEFNDIVKIAQSQRQSMRMGYVGR